VCSSDLDFDPLGSLAAERVIPDLVQGPQHSLRPTVALSGQAKAGQLFFNFEMETPFGLFKVESLALLKLRIVEAEVLARSEELKGEGQILNGIGHSLKSFGTNIIDVITDPIGTLAAIPDWLGRMGERISAAFDDSKKDKFQHQDSLLGGAFMGGWKRRLAYELGVDPYTTNPVMRELLTQMATYQAAGGNLVRVATFFVGGPAAVALQAQRFGGWRKQLADYSAGDLARYNEERLTKWGLEQPERDSFQDNPVLSPAHKTMTLNALEIMDQVPGRLCLLELGRRAKTEAQAIHLTRTAIYLAGYHAKESPLTSLEMVGDLVVARDSRGQVVIPYLGDYLPWTEPWAQALGMALAKAGPGPRVLLHQAHLTPLAKEKLARLKFTLRPADDLLPDQAADAMPQPVRPRGESKGGEEKEGEKE
jgi:hypothetical protein